MPRVAFWMLAAASVAYASDWFSMQFTLPGTFVAFAYPQIGLLVAMGILVRPWIAVGGFIGEMVLWLPIIGSIPVVAGLALAGAVQVFVISLVARRLLRERRAFEHRSDVVRFTLYGGLLGTLISATGGMGTLYAAGFVSRTEFPMGWLTWWTADVVSVLLLTPAIVVWVLSRSETRTVRREHVLAAGATVALAVTILSLRSDTTFLLAMLGLPLVGWVAFRMGSRSVTLVSLGLAAAALGHLTVPWRSTVADVPALLEAQTFIALASVGGLVVAASMQEERRRLTETAARELRITNETRNRLMQLFAHELNNPLTPMRLQLEALRHGAGPGPAPAQVEVLDTLERNVLRLSRLVRDLRDVSHLQAGGPLGARTQQTDAAAVVREALASYGAAAADARVAITLEADDDLHVDVDPDRLNQVVSNLLDNAIKYTPPGGRVHVSANRRANETVLSVRDEGCGFMPDQMGALFQPFTQVQPKDLQKAGSGLGLHIARSVVAGHGGTLECTSEGRGHGATFTMTLPTATPAPRTAPKSIPTPAGVPG